MRKREREMQGRWGQVSQRWVHEGGRQGADGGGEKENKEGY